MVTGALKQIDIRHGRVWGVNSNDDIFYKQDNIIGDWKSPDGKLKYISVDFEGTVWGVNSSDQIYYRNGIDGTWVLISGALKQLDVANSSVIGVNSNNDVYWRPGTTGNWE